MPNFTIENEAIEGVHLSSPRRVRTSPGEQPSLTEQHHKESCDIRFIMKKAEKTGMVSHLQKTEGRYIDMASRPDFDDAMNIIASANSMFETIPSRIREKFHNNPAIWLEYIQNPENREDMLSLGFTDTHLPPIEAEPEPPIEVVVTNPIEQPTDPQA